jgi:hypothetical protein
MTTTRKTMMPLLERRAIEVKRLLAEVAALKKYVAEPEVEKKKR